MALYTPASNIVKGSMDMGDTSFETQLVYGISSSLMIATRPPGYHSSPHVHDCEQLNILHSGELYIFTEEGAYLLNEGDAFRVKPNLVHWSWNRSDRPCVLIEVHSPGVQSDPRLAPFATSLLDSGESLAGDGPVNLFPPFSADEVARIEALPVNLPSSGGDR